MAIIEFTLFTIIKSIKILMSLHNKYDPQRLVLE